MALLACLYMLFVRAASSTARAFVFALAFTGRARGILMALLACLNVLLMRAATSMLFIRHCLVPLSLFDPAVC